LEKKKSIAKTVGNIANEFSDIMNYNSLQIHNFPQSNGRYKIVELLIGMTPHLIFPEENQRDHKEILKGFLDKNGIEYKIAALEGDKREKGPEPSHKNEEKAVYEVNGMGNMIIYPEKRIVHLPQGKSALYDIKVSELFERIIMKHYVNSRWVIVNDNNTNGESFRIHKYSCD